jgi:hypothetical protein
VIRDLLTALLGTQAPPVAPADLTTDEEPSDPARGRVVGWIAVAILGVVILVGAVAIVRG